MKKVSLKDIAQKVGVSTALVSYVLNNKKEGRIRKEVAEKIRETAKELNYRPNQIAKSLKTNRTYTLGLIVADISNTFWSGLARIIEDAAEKYKYTVLFGSSDENAAKSLKLLDVLLNYQVDGFIIAPSEDSLPQIEYLQKNDIPFVLIDRFFPELNTNFVAIDNFRASYTLVEHLVTNGYSNIGLITFKTSLFHLHERKRGYICALKDAKLPLQRSLIKEARIEHLQIDVEKALDELLQLPKPVDAILLASNAISMFALKHIVTLPIKVPADVALVSFDELDAAELFYAPLTYMRQPVEEMGEVATKMLIESIGKNNKVTQVVLLPDFKVRKSTRLIEKATAF